MLDFFKIRCKENRTHGKAMKINLARNFQFLHFRFVLSLLRFVLDRNDERVERILWAEKRYHKKNKCYVSYFFSLAITISVCSLFYTPWSTHQPSQVWRALFTVYSIWPLVAGEFYWLWNLTLKPRLILTI